MNNVIAIVEGKTELIFIKKILAPYLAKKNIFLTPTQLKKAGSNGGDVQFLRVKKQIKNQLEERDDIFVTTFFDFYGLKGWPNYQEILKEENHKSKIQKLYQFTYLELQKFIKNEAKMKRIILFFAIYEFEALLFSNPQVLEEQLKCSSQDIDKIINEHLEPEKINHGPEKTPSKKITKLSKNKPFKKTLTGIIIAEKIGIEKMREKCPNFHQWITRLEKIR